MPVTTKLGVIFNFKAIFPFSIQCDYLSPSGLQILDQVNYHVSVGRSPILREVGELMRCVGNIRYGALLQ